MPAEPTAADRGGTMIAAHRAGAALWPENSRTAFVNALRMPIDLIEFDVHRTRDGVLVVHHDPQLGRTADGTGAVAEMDWAELRQVPLRGAPQERIPLLVTILGLFDGSPIRPRLELKPDGQGRPYPGMAAEVWAVMRAAGLTQRTVVSSFDTAYLDEVRALGASRVLWLLKAEPTAALLADVAGFARAALGRGIGEVAVRGADATADLAAACRDNGLVLGAYAGKDMDFDRLLDIGLSVFTTDRPDLAVEARLRRKPAPAG
ncbi:MAG TPA: glycerophosphodiester phosphodiesterase family protein [Geminicoccaceae bacterium]|nr:glycerophosphodiester phosphodiesterase family protein [Geminicoccus sp.]HMU52638.1 glycerophosphodiester phosphodiesterase family protein [Geminicoccaceae bacterium]